MNLKKKKIVSLVYDYSKRKCNYCAYICVQMIWTLNSVKNYALDKWINLKPNSQSILAEEPTLYGCLLFISDMVLIARSPSTICKGNERQGQKEL